MVDLRALALATFLLATFLLAGCPDAGADCDYSLDDACITAENLAQCEDMSAQCPGQVAVMESCPLQFGCAVP